MYLKELFCQVSFFQGKLMPLYDIMISTYLDRWKVLYIVG